LDRHGQTVLVSAKAHALHNKQVVPGFVKLEEKWSVRCAEAAVLAQASAASCLAIELLSCQALPGQPLILPTKHDVHLDVLLDIFISAQRDEPHYP